LERQIIERAELLFDQPEDFEEKDDPSEDFAALHFQRIQAIPVLTDAEERDLLQRWCEFRDEKARERIILAHMRMVPPIARNAAYKAGFQPDYGMMAGSAKWTAGVGLDEVISDLTAAGNLGLMLAIDGYRLGKDAKFYTYATQCVRHEVWKQATFLRSVVRRKDGSSATMDLSIDSTKPDVHHVYDNVGSRANPSVGGSDKKDEAADWSQAKSQTRLRPQPSEPITLKLDALTKDERKIIKGRVRGLKLREIAEELGLSTATVWRREQSAIKRIRADGNVGCRSAARNPSSPGGHGLHEWPEWP
jgi:RNA polymerase sigma factor (sigma-70 family)